MRTVPVRALFASIVLTMGVSVSLCVAEYPYHNVYGCEANPTGNAIGGGGGYTDIYTTGEYVVTTVDELTEALGKAQAGEVVFIPDGVEIDLTGRSGITIPGGVTLAGTRGHNGSEGARLYNTPPEHFTGIVIGGPDVRVTGLRFDGGYAGRQREVWRDRCLRTNYPNTEVDNCEICNFSAAAIAVGSLAANAYIHHNYFHHIWQDGLGYPIHTNSSYVRVIGNIFNYGRHHMAAGGLPGTGYEFAWNWIGPNANCVPVDMHGGRDRSDGTDIAGDWIHIHHNTFVDHSDPDSDRRFRHIGIRGKPSQGAEIHNNWFARPWDDQQQDGEQLAPVYATGNTRVYNNAIGPDRELQPEPYRIIGIAEGNVLVTEPLDEVVRPRWLAD